MYVKSGLSIFALILVLLLLAVDIIAVVLWESRWWVSTIVAVVLVLQILALNYQCKYLLELSNVSNPTSYLTVTFCKVTSVYG